jgi:hypothetical protein
MFLKIQTKFLIFKFLEFIFQGWYPVFDFWRKSQPPLQGLETIIFWK